MGKLIVIGGGELKDLQKALFGLGIKVDSAKGMDGGATNMVYLIESGKDKFVLKMCNGLNRGQVQKLINLLLKINFQRDITTKPLNKKPIRLSKDYGYVYNFFNGNPFRVAKVKNRFYKFGKILGEVDKSMLRLKSPIGTTKLKEIISNLKGYNSKVLWIANNFRGGRAIKEGMLNSANKGLSLVDPEFYKGCRVSFIHGDLNMDNVIYNGKSNLYFLIDMTSLNNDLLVNELTLPFSYMLTNSDKENKKRIKSMLNGYESEINLTIREKKAIVDLVILRRIGELRWLIDQHNSGRMNNKNFKFWIEDTLKYLKISVDHYARIKEHCLN